MASRRSRTRLLLTPEVLAAFRELGRVGGKKGGAKGGRARAKNLTAERRREIARRAARARWKRRENP